MTVCHELMHSANPTTNRFGDYVLHDRIGAGGMAEIFLATATGIEGFEKRVVIKRILPSLSDDEQFVRMFIEEAKLCVALRHPNIVQVHDLGEIDAQYYIAMEYVDGRDLLKTLAACGKKKIGFPTDIALFIVMEVLKGLHYAHQLKKPDGEPLGIIHRDVSPSNVLLSFEGEVKIGDFGIAKASTREKTATGILKGKFGYMAPEQVTGAKIDHRADVFAVGIVLYELLTGHRLFAGKNDLAVLEKVRDARIEPPPRHYRQDLDDELEHIVLRALSRDSRDRFQTAYDLHDAIHDYVYRSRATVGPAHLARFMQTLFLSDPDEIERRSRVNLPQPRPYSSRNGNNGAANGTANGRISRDKIELYDAAGDFDEKTPLLDPAENFESALSSSVVFIEDPDSWEQAGSSALIAYALESGPRDLRGPPTPPPRTQAPSIATVPLEEDGSEQTARTDIEMQGRLSDEVELNSDDVVALDTDAPVELDDSDHSPQARLEALRRSREEDEPTDLDLSEESKRLVEESGGRPLPRASETKFNRPPTPKRAPSALDTMIEDSAEEIRREVLEEEEDEEEVYTEDHHIDPSDIVERTHSKTAIDERDEEELSAEALTGEVEPTIRFDSSSLPREMEDPGNTTDTENGSDPALITAKRVEEYPDLAGGDELGTFEVEQSDLPTSEVAEPDLREQAPGPSVTDTVPSPSMDDEMEEDEEGSRTDISLDAQDVMVAPVDDDTNLGGPTLHGQEDTSSDPSEFGDRTALDRMVSDVTTDRSASQQRAASKERAVADIRRARRASRMANELAKEEARTPSRRRPITARRPRPLLVPSEEGESRLEQRSPPGPSKRRVTTTRPFSVVNPRTRGVSIRRPIVQSKAEEAKSRAQSDLDDIDETRLGLLVEEDTQSGEMAAAKAPDPTVESVPSRRRSSGITAALTEAAQVDEEIAEIQKSAVVRAGTAPGDLTDETPEEFDEFPEDECTVEGTNIREAIARRESRRRIVTRSFVLYSENEASFADDSEVSAPMITSAGRLEDEGASDLFGVLEVLDDGTPGMSFDPDEEPSLETESRNYRLFEGSTTRPAPTRPESVDETGEQRAEYGDTKFGSLAPDDPPSVDEGLEAFDEDETTASVTDGQVLSVSQLLRSTNPVDPEVSEIEEVGESSGISIRLDPSDMGEDSGLFDREASQVELPIGSDAAFEFEFSENEEPTQEQSDAFEIAQAKRDVRGRSILEQPVGILLQESTSNERPAHGLISDSFDLQVKNAPPPVRPVSMATPGTTNTGLPETPPLAPEPQRARPSKNANASALRRVVERHKAVKEVRGRGTAGPTQPPPAPGGKTPPMAPAVARPSRALPSPGQIYPPAASVTREGGGINKFATIVVLLAVLLAVAATVSLVLSRSNQVPIPALPKKQALSPTPPIEVPPEETELERAPEKPLEETVEQAAAAQKVEAPPPAAKPKSAQEPDEPEEPEVEREAVTPKKAPAKAPPKMQKTRRRRTARTIRPAKPAKRSKPRRRATRSRRPIVRVVCSEPVDFKLSNGVKGKDETRWRMRLEPGSYRITFTKDGVRTNQVFRLVPGGDLTLRCP